MAKFNLCLTCWYYNRNLCKCFAEKGNLLQDSSRQNIRRNDYEVQISNMHNKGAVGKIDCSRSQERDGRYAPLQMVGRFWDIQACPPRGDSSSFIPAWSLHRLWELANLRHIVLDSGDEIPILYDEVIAFMESEIKEGMFNRNYLED